MPSGTDSQTIDGLPIVSGGFAGIGAFLTGYALTYLWKAPAIRETLAPINAFVELFGITSVSTWKVVGWLYFGAHFVATEIQAGPFGPRFVNFVEGGEGPLELLYAVPPIVLFVAGLALVARSTSDLTRMEGLKVGATVTIGYVISTTAGAIAFRVAGNGPNTIPAILLAGVLYPIVFGSLGGLLAPTLRGR